MKMKKIVLGRGGGEIPSVPIGPVNDLAILNKNIQNIDKSRKKNVVDHRVEVEI